MSVNGLHPTPKGPVSSGTSPALRDVTVRITGAAGEGVSSMGEIFARMCSRLGYHVNSYTSYQSVIRGGHVWFQVRAANEKVRTHGHEPDVVLALNPAAADIHVGEVKPRGGVILDSAFTAAAQKTTPGARVASLPLSDMAKQFEPKGIMKNTVALGAMCGFLDMPVDAMNDALQWNFEGKGPAVVQANHSAAKAGYEATQKQFGKVDWVPKPAGKPKLLLTGNQAIAAGALAAGMTFYAAYPMTPASSILHYLAEEGSKYGCVVKQVEDEIGVINMTIGAAHAGARAMCGTSGGGFALMSEALGMAGITETPLVVVESQRGGPSTGLPTKTEQGDLWQMLGASQGDFPKAILAPGWIEDAFQSTVDAFNWAEKYQMPVLVASDLVLSEHLETVDALPFDAVKIDRGEWASSANAPGENGFLRFKYTPSGVSPRAVPGTPGRAYTAGSDEHDEHGYLVSDILSGIPKFVEVRREMMEKRMRKLVTLMHHDAKTPVTFGPANAQVTLVGWGGNWGPLVEGSQWLTAEGIPTNVVHFKQVWPFPVQEAKRLLSHAKVLVGVESNFTGQFCRLLRGETGIDVHHKLLKYDGEPIYPAEIAHAVKAWLGTSRGPAVNPQEPKVPARLGGGAASGRKVVH